MSGALFLCLEKNAVVARVFLFLDCFCCPTNAVKSVEILDVNRNGSFRSQVAFSLLGDSGVGCQWFRGGSLSVAFKVISLVAKCRAARATTIKSIFITVV